jgi:hypothetical protein
MGGRTKLDTANALNAQALFYDFFEILLSGASRRAATVPNSY